MRSRSSSKSGLGLVELIIAILVFAVASAVTMRLFATAHFAGQKAEDKTQAVMAAQTVAEELKARAGEPPESVLQDIFHGRCVQNADNDFTVYYDGAWAAVDSDPVFTLRVVVSQEAQPEGKLTRAELTMEKCVPYPFDGGKTLFQTQISKYTPGG